MGHVRVPLADATERRLPLVSVRSGAIADGYLGVPVGLGFAERILWSLTERTPRGPVVQLPLTQREFDQVMRLRRAERSGLVNAGLFVVLGLVLARFPLLLPLGLVIGAVSLMLVAVSRWGLGRLLPDVTVRKGAVTITGVHEEFVARVENGGRRYS